MTNAAAEQLRVHGIELEVVRRGKGRSILALHGFDTMNPAAPFLDLLARHGQIVARHPRASATRRGPRISTASTTWCISILALSTRCPATRSR